MTQGEKTQLRAFKAPHPCPNFGRSFIAVAATAMSLKNDAVRHEILQAKNLPILQVYRAHPGRSSHRASPITVSDRSLLFDAELLPTRRCGSA